MTTTAYSDRELKDLELAVSELTLPICDSPSHPVHAVAMKLERVGIALADQPPTIRRLAAEWREAGAAPALLREVVRTALAASGDEQAKKLAGRYFDLHRKLQTKLAMSFRSATVIAGYSGFIASLALEHSMSAAQIATLLRARGVEDDTATWAAVQEALATLSMTPSFTSEQVAIQIQEDAQAEESFFADADWHGSLEQMGALVSELGLSPDTISNLAEIVPETGKAHWPYVFMLHFSCVPLEWFDHSPVFLYEFSPRGESADLLLETYKGFDTGSNPFLNNAKSVDRADQNWADSKVRMKLRGAASALVSVLEETGSLPFHSKRTFGAALRQWCLRQLRLHRQPPRLLTSEITKPEALSALLRSVAASETNTRGVIEQRFVDVRASLLHTDRRWRPRGLGDPVNAANTPRRKLGDCEFQDAEGRRVEAYEAHAGRLTEQYFRNHEASLEKLIRVRFEDEWSSYSEPSDWEVNVRFVCHATELTEPITTEIEGVKVRFEFVGYSEFIRNLDLADPTTTNAFERHFVDVLNEPRVSQGVRDQVLELTRPG